ncbi:hypothetical protein V6R21_13670 [Limibacter armeniacum]|uniref:hypothetical protein n=1 Tax=Limibacter armeniacum TaxID=466084 RepID=UPI002FE58C94
MINTNQPIKHHWVKTLAFMLLFLLPCQLYSQDIGENPFRLKNFDLVYGNSNYNIHDFALSDPYKVVLLTKSDGALFFLLDQNNLCIDSLFFRSAPADIHFWHKQDTLFYQSMFFYKSDYCDLNYKSGIASFSIEQDKLAFNNCIGLDDSYIGKELFQTTENFKVTLLENEKSKSNKIGYAINDKYIVRRNVPVLKGSLVHYFSYAELNKQLYIYDVMENSLSIFKDQKTFETITLENSIAFPDEANSYRSYELLADKGTGQIYLLGSHRSFNGKPSKRNKELTHEQQFLYRLEGKSWKKVDFEIPQYIYKIRIDHNKIFAVFEIAEESGTKRKYLFESIDRIF